MINLNCGICLFLITLSVVTGCFITNCPPGGKRSGIERKTRQCEQCGPPGAGGRCYGPSICCSPELGCLIATPETYSCQLENRHTTLCQNPGATCAGPNGDISGGQCGAEGICCNSETCTMDETCHDEASVTRESVAKLSGLYHHRYPLDVVFQRFVDGQHSQHHRLPARLPLPTQSSSSSNDY